MNSCRVCVAFKEINDGKFRPNELVRILSCLADDLETFDLGLVNIEIASGFIHELYVSQSPLVRREVLRICRIFAEKISENEFLSNHFDKIVAYSIDQKIPDASSTHDDEKELCFQISKILLNRWCQIPDSIIRAMISLFYFPKSEYKSTIISILIELLYITDISERIHEIGKVLTDFASENESKSVSSLICHSIENHMHLTCQPSFLSSLFLCFSSTQNGFLSLMISILKTWPGLLYFGIQCGGIRQVLLLIKKEPEIVISLLKHLLKTTYNKNSVISPYSGLLLYYLYFNNILTVLSMISSSNSEAASFHNSIAYLTNNPKLSIMKGVSLNDRNKKQTSQVQLYKLFKNFASTQINNSLISLTYSSDPLQWDWKGIQAALSVLLPYNEIEAQSSSSKTFYLKLLDYYSGTYVAVQEPLCSRISDCFLSLIDLLITKDYGFSILEEHNNIKKILLISIHTVSNSQSLDLSSPLLVMFKCLLSWLVRPEGIKLVQSWDITDALNQIGVKCHNPLVVDHILPLIKFYPISTMTVPIYSKFLSSKDVPIMNLAIRDLRKKLDDTPEFHVSGFLKLLVPYIKTLDISDDISNMPIALNLVCEFLSKDERCLDIIAGDMQIHSLLSKHSHPIYSILLGREESLPLSNIENEIEWWMNQGMEHYVDTFDTAMEVSFESSFHGFIEKYPSVIFSSDNEAMIPPHLFGTLSKTKVGIEKLSVLIPSLLNDAKEGSSLKKQRAAFFALSHFGSTQNTSNVVERFEIPKHLINFALSSKSFILRGTLLSCLSIHYVSPYFSSILAQHSFQLYRYGEKSCIIPISLDVLDIELSGDNNSSFDISVLEDLYPSLFIELLNPITIKRSKTELITHYREKPNELLTNENARLASILMAKYSFPSEGRNFLYGLFRSVPIVKIPTFEADPSISSVIKSKLAEISTQIYENKSFNIINV